MPLLDHFHAPLRGRRQWKAFHGWWASTIAGALNEGLLPPDYFADFQVQVGATLEVDVGTFDDKQPALDAGHPNGPGGTAVATRTWTPPAALTSIPASFPDDIEIRIFSDSGGATLVAAIELVSPRNKDRSEARRAFAAKCATYLQRGIGVVVIDIVTDRRANLHDELTDLMGSGETFRFPFDSLLYATAYHPLRREEREEIDWWAQALTVGQPLPTMPLPVRGLAILPLELEASYMLARQRSRLG